MYSTSTKTKTKIQEQTFGIATKSIPKSKSNFRNVLKLKLNFCTKITLIASYIFKMPLITKEQHKTNFLSTTLVICHEYQLASFEYTALNFHPRHLKGE